MISGVGKGKEGALINKNEMCKSEYGLKLKDIRCFFVRSCCLDFRSFFLLKTQAESSKSLKKSLFLILLISLQTKGFRKSKSQCLYNWFLLYRA